MRLIKLVDKKSGKERFFNLEDFTKFVHANKVLFADSYSSDLGIDKNFDMYYYENPTKAMLTLYGSKK